MARRRWRWRRTVSPLCATVYMGLLWLVMLWANSALAQSPPAEQRPLPKRFYYADKVITFRLGEGSFVMLDEDGKPMRIHNDPNQALGPPDHGLLDAPYTGAVSLGNRGELILGFPSCIEDGEGDDFIVHEIVQPERAKIFGSLTHEPRDFRFIGTAPAGPARFDLKEEGLERVYLIQIIDQNESISPSPYAGFDVDAIEVIQPCQPFTS